MERTEDTDKEPLEKWVIEILEGKTVNLRLEEKEDMKLVSEWLNNPDYWGEYLPLKQQSRTEIEKEYDSQPQESKWFIVEKKEGSKIGSIGYFLATRSLVEIGYSLIPNERGKGYCSEAAKILVDYLFLSKSIVRVQSHTDVRNLASQRVLEKTGFKKEGVVRKSLFARGEWRDMILCSILREEWKERKILSR
jgi:RimJ/RimL family protein N-acetyltransferase